MALTLNQFIAAWTLGANDVVGVEVPLTTSADVGTYGFRSVGIPSATCGTGTYQLAYMVAVNGDVNRANAEVLTIMEVSNAASPAYNGGVLVRGSGAVSAENGYYCVVDTASHSLIVGRIVAGAKTVIASFAYTWPAVAEDWYIRFRVNGSTLRARAWRYDQVEPLTWDIDTTDANVVGVGYIGFVSICSTANSAGFSLPGFLAVGTNGEIAPRPMSDLEQRQWFNDDSNPRVGIAEIGVLGQDVFGAAVASFVTISTWPFVTKASDVPPSQAYDDTIVQAPTFTSKVSQSFFGRSSQSVGDCIIKNENGKRDPWLAWNWDGRSFDYFVGGLGWRKWDYVRALTATVAEIYVPKKDQIGFRLRDNSALLNRKLQLNIVGGATSNAGNPAPITFGRVFNIEPVLKDDVAFRYKFHDESTAGATGIIQVRDLGASVTFTDQGNGEFTLAAQPAGQITMDVTMDLSAGSVTHAGKTHARALQTVLEDRAGFGPGSTYLGLRSGSLANFGADPTDETGMYVKDDVNIMDAMDQIAISAGGFWCFNRLGLLCAAALAIPAGPYYDHTLSEDDVSTLTIDKFILPSAVEQLGYRKNWTPQSVTFAGTVSLLNATAFTTPATYTAIVPSYSGLDQPSNHALRVFPVNRDVLFCNQADAEDEVRRLAALRGKLCVLVSFVTKVNSLNYNLGDSLVFSYPRYGFDLGAAGLIVGIDEDFGKNQCTLTLFVQIPGQFPVTSAGSPYVTLADYY